MNNVRDIGVEVKNVLNLENYDSNRGIYKTWYGLEFRVKYVNPEEFKRDIRATTDFLKREIRVSNEWEDPFEYPPLYFYHEKQHADTMPIFLLVKSVLSLGAFYLIKELVDSDLVAYLGMVDTFFGFGYFPEEVYAHVRTSLRFADRLFEL